MPSRQLFPGAVTGGIIWTVLQALGAFLVHLHSDSVCSESVTACSPPKRGLVELKGVPGKWRVYAVTSPTAALG